MNRKVFLSIVLAMAVLGLAALPVFAAGSFAPTPALTGVKHPTRRGPQIAAAGSGPYPLVTSPGLTAAAQGLPQWTQVNYAPNPLMSNATALAEFKGSLYAATTQTDFSQPPAAVYRLIGANRWVKVSPDGFGDIINNQAIWDMVVFQGQLYAGTGWGYNPQTDDSNGLVSQIWRTSDGNTWEAVDRTGFGDPNNYLANKLTIYHGMIYAAVQQEDYFTPAGALTPARGIQIYRSASGNPGTWTKATTAFDDPNYRYQDPTGFISFQGMLYMGTETPLAELWRSKNGADWEPVTQDGFGNPQYTEAGGFSIFKGQLYWGLFTVTSSAQIWRSGDGKSWTNVMQGGFGNPNNLKLEALIPYGGELYAVADNIKEGISVWRSVNGKQWQQANAYGFNGVCSPNVNCNNVTLNGNASVVFNDRLYIGAWNVAGGQIWRLNAGN